MQQAYKPLLDPLDLTYPQFLLMSTLWHKEAPTVSEIGEEVHLESNTLSPMLKKLEAKGFLTRQRDPSDERQVRIHLTEAGRELQSAASDIAACIFAQSCLTENQAIALRDEVNALRARFKSDENRSDTKS